MVFYTMPVSIACAFPLDGERATVEERSRNDPAR